MADIRPTFQGEVQFRRWSDSSTQGVQITFALPDSSDLEPLKAKAGKRFMAVLVEIGDDEQPVQPQPTEKPRRTHKDTRGPLCREACELCVVPQFQEWAATLGYTENEAGAKACVLNTCNVQSRKDFDADQMAGEVFIERIRIPFMHWQRRQG